MNGKVTDYNIHNRRHSMANINLWKSHMAHFFCASSHRFRDFNVSYFYLENLGKGHGVQHLQWCHLMETKSNFINGVACIVVLVLTVSEILTLKNCWPWKCRSRSRCTTFATDGRYGASYLMVMMIFALSVTIYKIFATEIKFLMCDLGNEGQGQNGLKTKL